MIPSTMSIPDAKGDGAEAINAFDPSRLMNDNAAKQEGYIVKLECPGCQIEGSEGARMSLVWSSCSRLSYRFAYRSHRF